MFPAVPAIAKPPPSQTALRSIEDMAWLIKKIGNPDQ